MVSVVSSCIILVATIISVAPTGSVHTDSRIENEGRLFSMKTVLWRGGGRLSFSSVSCDLTTSFRAKTQESIVLCGMIGSKLNSVLV